MNSQAERAKERVLGLFHVAVEIREVHDAGEIGITELNAAGSEKVRHSIEGSVTARGTATHLPSPPPPHLSRASAPLGGRRGDFPLAEQLADEVLSLPIGPHITAAQVEQVAAAIQEFFQQG